MKILYFVRLKMSMRLFGKVLTALAPILFWWDRQLSLRSYLCSLIQSAGIFSIDCEWKTKENVSDVKTARWENPKLECKCRNARSLSVLVVIDVGLSGLDSSLLSDSSSAYSNSSERHAIGWYAARSFVECISQKKLKRIGINRHFGHTKRHVTGWSRRLAMIVPLCTYGAHRYINHQWCIGNI